MSANNILNDALERMDRARRILTDNNPTPNCNWGMLDTSDLRAELARRDAVVSEGQAVGVVIPDEDHRVVIDWFSEVPSVGTMLYTRPAAPAPEAPTAAPSARTLANEIAQLEPVAKPETFANWTRQEQDAYVDGYYSCRFAARALATSAPTAAQAPEVAALSEDAILELIIPLIGKGGELAAIQVAQTIAAALATQPKSAPTEESK